MTHPVDADVQRWQNARPEYAATAGRALLNTEAVQQFAAAIERAAEDSGRDWTLLEPAELAMRLTAHGYVVRREHCPTCTTGRNRHTVGMVCQTCGTDYGDPGPQTEATPAPRWRCGKCAGGDFPEHSRRCPKRGGEAAHEFGVGERCTRCGANVYDDALGRIGACARAQRGGEAADREVEGDTYALGAIIDLLSDPEKPWYRVDAAVLEGLMRVRDHLAARGGTAPTEVEWGVRQGDRVYMIQTPRDTDDPSESEAVARRFAGYGPGARTVVQRDVSAWREAQP